MAALKTAGSLARDLGACIRLRAADRCAVCVASRCAASVGSFYRTSSFRLGLPPGVRALRAQRSFVSVSRSGRHSLAGAEAKLLGCYLRAQTLVAHGRTSEGESPSIQRPSSCFCRPKERKEIGSAMKTETLTQPAGNGMESPSYSVDDISPNSSAIVGVTLTGDWQDVMAVLRTAILLARNLRTPLFFGLPGEDVLAVHLGGAPNATLVSELLDSASNARS